MTNGQSNLTTGRIADAHERFNSIRQVASACIPAKYMLPSAGSAHPSPQPERRLGLFSRFRSAHDCDRQTERQTTLLGVCQ